MPADRAASSSTNAPKTSVWMNSPGDSIERSTWDSAAKLTIASQPSTASATALDVGDVAVHELDLVVGQPLAGSRAGPRR